ncbi:MAG: ComF family protein [Clostridia bacterium]|nr:ComF family protein [Clostridia bacterium]
MNFITRVKRFINEYLFNAKWCCNACGKEIFNDKYFCDDCIKKLPFNDKSVCDHCGRKVATATPFCSTCKERLLSIDKGRSAFVYDKPISYLIQGAKYDKRLYLLEAFADYLAPIYLKNYFNADYFCFIPMTDKAKKKRGYNQSQLLCEKLSQKVNVPVLDCLEKVKETNRQAKLGRQDRLKNLEGAFRVKDRKNVKDKTLLIVDDVTTTGATAEIVASALKKSGAKCVYLLAVASVPSKSGY